MLNNTFIVFAFAHFGFLVCRHMLGMGRHFVDAKNPKIVAADWNRLRIFEECLSMFVQSGKKCLLSIFKNDEIRLCFHML